MKPTTDVTLSQQRIAPLNMDAETFRQHGHLLIDEIAAFLDSFTERPVTTGKQPKEIRAVLGEDTLPADGMPVENVFKEARKLLFDHSLLNGSPRFWGYITSSAAPAGILAEMLAASVNPNVGAYILSPMATEIERQAIRWIAEFIGFTKDCGGLFVSGGNMANITGLLAARKAKATWNIRKEGLINRHMLIYCSKGTHTWINKAADLLGFGTNNIRWIEMDEQQQMNVHLLEQQIRIDQQQGYLPFVVVATAGSVSTGAIDPFEIIASVCRRYNLWLHVDGAYGAPAVAVPEFSHLFKGMEQADSIALDPHKWLYSPLEAGCILVRNEQALRDTFSFRPEYYNFNGKEDDPVINFHESGFQNSRGFRALKVWITLKQAGKNGYISMIHDDIKLAAKLFSIANAHEELEAVSHQLSIVTFRFIPKEYNNAYPADYLDKLNEALVNRVQAGGEVFLSNAVVNNNYCLRVCIVNFRTSAEDIETLAAIVIRTGRAIVTGSPKKQCGSRTGLPISLTFKIYYYEKNNHFELSSFIQHHFQLLIRHEYG
jgi:aromatic-L-amino-acid/L-tryptophan decarboxylase